MTVWKARINRMTGMVVVEHCEVKITAKQAKLSERLFVWEHDLIVDRNYPFAKTRHQALKQLIDEKVAESAAIRQELRRVQKDIELVREEMGA